MLSNLVHQFAQFSSAIRPARFASGWWIIIAMTFGLTFWVRLVHLIVGWLQ
ncbi:hypothetical protein C8J27_110105 [Rhodobacter aestuarii]|uniref:Uncharacterized protein n=1 Tax=Rhodobacter aestuarii TaxID=453582 RepID=A0A1N7Q2Z4_9RHOB|nr:hypothetical protein [Rhodobacter aestuarii]PTV94054.1 hypothetical protein C8J27_110105 [Rhodobacter aestuarii]SIT17049.1 hypothetical protein SAMN05421580_112105 [Rhodobacter aestuarii]